MKNILNHIEQIYKNSSYEIRLKSVISIVILLIFDILYTLFILNMVIHLVFNYLFVTFLIAEAVLIFATISLFKGKYELSTNIIGPTFFISISVALSTMGLEAYSYIFESAAYGAIFLIISLLLSSRKITNSFAGFILFSSMVHILIDFLNGKLNSGIFISLGIPAIVLLLVFIGVGVSSQTIFKKLLNNLAAELERSHHAEQKSRRIMSQVAVQMNNSDLLKIAAEETTSSSYEIEQNVQSINKQIIYLNEQFQNTESSIGQINNRIDNLAELSSRQTDSVSAASIGVKNIASSIASVTKEIQARTEDTDSLKEASVEGLNTLNETTEAFRRVVTMIDSIKEMTQLISDISSQTNLLSMNAAIEAAHAGDSGKGFAVVAEEIRKLAESSRISAESIERDLKALTDAIYLTDQRVGQSGKSFNQINLSAARVNSAMNDIASIMKKLDNDAVDVNNAAEILADSTSAVDENTRNVAAFSLEILKNVQQVSRIIDEVSQGADEIKLGAANSRDSVAELTKLADSMKTQTALLQDALQ